MHKHFLSCHSHFTCFIACCTYKIIFFPMTKKKKKMIQNVWAQGRENKREKKYLLLRRDQWFWKVKPSFGSVRKLRLVRVTISIKSSCLLTCTCLLYYRLSAARISVNMCVWKGVCLCFSAQLVPSFLQ